MIARALRFHGYGSLNYVYKHGQTIRGAVCSLRFIHNDRRKSARAAVVVSKKVNKSAVTRNRIRRRLYEIIRQHQPAITEPYDMVFIVYSDQILNMGNNELTKLVTEQLGKAKII